MQVIIPLAGFGTRLRPHTYSRPKPLLSVAGKPVLGHLLDKLRALPIEDTWCGAGIVRSCEKRSLVRVRHLPDISTGTVPGAQFIYVCDRVQDRD